MKVAITGTSGLARVIKDKLEGQDIKVSTPRVEDLTMNGTNWWGFDYDNSNHVDILINFAHQGFDQTRILEITHQAWKDDRSEYLINFSSRAAQPNISKGHVYAAEKAALNHLANNLTYNSDRKYRMTTLNLGLMNNDDLPSLSHGEVAELVSWLIANPTIEITDMTVSAHANYREVQNDKQTLKEAFELAEKYK